MLTPAPWLAGLIDRAPDTAWQQYAACRDADHRLFLATTRDTARRALEFCAACPVRRECARACDGADGVWGGAVYGQDGKRIPAPTPPTLDACPVCGGRGETGNHTCPGAVCVQRRRRYFRDRARIRYAQRRAAA